MVRSDLLARIKRELQLAFDGRFEAVVLYGSEARGHSDPESDIDLLVVLKGPVALGADLEVIVRALYPLQLELERSIHAQPVDTEDFEAAEFALYRNAKREGVFA